MGDVKDKRKIQADRVARKNKDKDKAKASRPDTTSTKGTVPEGVPPVTQTPDQTRKKEK